MDSLTLPALGNSRILLGAQPLTATLHSTPRRKVLVAFRVRASQDQSPANDPFPSTNGNTRRQALVAAGAAAAAVLVPPGLTLLSPAPALAADIVQRSQRAKFQGKLKVALKEALRDNQQLIPSLLRLAINDALTYDKETKTGGANGSIHFQEELGRPENAGLEAALKLLEGVKKTVDEGAEGGPISYADLIQFAGSTALKRTFLNDAISKAGGDENKGIGLYRATGSEGQWGSFDKLFGRADAAAPDPEGRVLEWGKASTAELKAKFEPFGLKARQIVVLAIFLSDDFEAFEDRLAADPEFEPWVNKYRKSRTSVSQTDYQVDLIGAFAKFSTLGAPINTLAYTYYEPPRKIRF